MSTALQTIQEKAQLLPPQKQADVIDFIEKLLEQEQPPKTRGLKFDWVDGPDDPPVPYTSVELQHQVLEWRIEKAEEFLDKK